HVHGGRARAERRLQPLDGDVDDGAGAGADDLEQAQAGPAVRARVRPAVRLRRAAPRPRRAQGQGEARLRGDDDARSDARRGHPVAQGAAPARQPLINQLELLSLVVPVFNEGDNFARLIAEIDAKIHAAHEIVVVYDFDEDNTLPVVRERFADRANLRLVKNPTRGVLNAIKAGFAAAKGDAMLVVMADVSDDLVAVDGMVELMRDGYDLVCGSRYMRGGKQLGGPVVKSLLSRAAGLSLHYLLRIPT